MSHYSAAWHPLPDDAGTLRYWDGQQWTNYFKHWDGHQWVDGQRPVAPTPPAQPTYPVQQAQPVQQARPVEYQQPHEQAAAEPLVASTAGDFHQYAQDPFAAAEQKPKRSRAVWMVPVAVVTVLLMSAASLYFGVFYSADPESGEAASGGNGEVSSSAVDAIVGGDFTNALTSEVVYTDPSKGLDYTTPYVDLESRDTQLEIPLAVDSLQAGDRPEWAKGHERVDENGDSASWAVRIFADADLKVEVGGLAYLQDGVLQVGPYESEMASRLDEDGQVVPEYELSTREGGMTTIARWGMRDTYYAVRYVSDDGELSELERPVVSKLSFTQSLPTPSVRVATSADVAGSLELSWVAVPGATSYGVFVSHLGEDTAPFARNQVLLGQTTDTVWTPEVDGDHTDTIYQNYAMNTSEYGAEDDQYSLGTEYGVIAYDSTGEVMSGMGTVAANEASIETLPYFVDFDVIREYQQELPCMATEDCTFNDNMTFAPYISIGGEVRTGSVYATDILWTEEWNSYRVRLEVEGTQLSYTQSLITADEVEAAELVEAFNERAANDRLATGGLPPEREAQLDVSDEVVSDYDPSALTNIVSMDHDLVTYIAAHMYEGNTAVDMSEYLGFWTWNEINRAAYVASDQNRQFGAEAWDAYSGDTTLYIEYRGRERAQQAMTEVRNIVQELQLQSMTDTEKVRAINGYIVDNVEYNFEALDALADGESIDPYWKSWTLDGAVLDGLTVCAGYSYMFNAMAKEAGLDSVYVSGYVDGSQIAHAWNKVKVDGEWKIVDTTWNDGLSNEDYLLKDDEGLPYGEQRYESDWWVMGDPSNYATP